MLLTCCIVVPRRIGRAEPLVNLSAPCICEDLEQLMTQLALVTEQHTSNYRILNEIAADDGD
jgi:flagellar assembly factor FliW